MQMMRDPSAMQNMMRQQDIAMSNIENMPGGFDALRRMYTEVQEPMMDAMSGGGQNEGSTSGGSGSSSRDGGTSGAAGAAMPNPWGTSSSSSSSAGAGGSSATAGSGPGSAPFNPWAAGGAGVVGNSAAGANPWAAAGGAGASGALGAGANPWAAGGAGATGMPGMPSDMNGMVEMLENPMMRQMMDQMMSNPQMMQQMMNSNPQLRQMMEQNPQAAAMFSNPETMRAMMDPANLRAMMQLQQSMQQLGQSVPGFPSMPPAGAAGGQQAGLDFSTLLGSMQGTSLSSPGGAGMGGGQARSPEERFRVQLQSLRDMGFDDDAANIRALEQNHGNVNRAIDYLLTQPVSAPAPAPAAAAAEPAPAPAAAPSSEADDTATAEHPEKNDDDKKNE